MSKEQYIAFDIETAALPFESFDESQQEYLMRHAKTEEEKEQKLFEMALTPLTSAVVCIGMLIIEKEDNNWKIVNEIALSSDPDIEDGKEIISKINDSINWEVATEYTILTHFWKYINKYKDATLISFNGRNFDAPFLMLRSALLKIRPSKNLMSGTKFNYHQHIDLIDELTFYTPAFKGATKRFNFDFYAKQFGIISPKAQGVDGSKVGELYQEKNHKAIAEYCMRDVMATWELFLVWREYLKF